MSSIDDRVAAADKRAEDAVKRARQLRAQRDLIEARKLQTMLKGQRSDDTRRKILIGALYLDRMERDDQLRSSVLADLSAYLTRPDDRALFGLDQQPEPIQQPEPDTYHQPSYQPNYQNTQD